MSAARQTVHVRVNDSATGQPTPVRLRLTGPDEEYFAPFGRVTDFATSSGQDVGGNVLLGMKPWCYIDGKCEVELPPGPLLVEASKGFEHTPLRQQVVLKPGQVSLRLSLERFIDLGQERWYSGDTRVSFLPPHAALLEAAAENVAVVNLLAVQWAATGKDGKSRTAFPNLLAFSGQVPAVERPGHLVVVNTHNTHPELGSLALLHCHRVVYPLTFGGPGGFDNWSLASWCDQCHRKGGLVVWTRPVHESADFAFGEPLADLLLGKVDAFEVDFYEDSPFDVLPLWYALLGCGLRVPLVGASGKDGNGIALGSMRTYARLLADEGLTYKSWIEAVRAGRTFVTNGPLLTFTVDGQDSGTQINLSDPTSAIQVRAEARSVIPFDELEILANGTVIASARPSGAPASAVIEASLTVAETGWMAARCRGAHQIFHRPANQRVFAHTSPIYVNVPGRPQPLDRTAQQSFLDHLERMLAWATTKGRYENEQQRIHLTDVFRSASEVLLKRISPGAPGCASARS